MTVTIFIDSIKVVQIFGFGWIIHLKKCPVKCCDSLRNCHDEPSLTQNLSAKKWRKNSHNGHLSDDYKRIEFTWISASIMKMCHRCWRCCFYCSPAAVTAETWINQWLSTRKSFGAGKHRRRLESGNSRLVLPNQRRSSQNTSQQLNAFRFGVGLLQRQCQFLCWRYGHTWSTDRNNNGRLNIMADDGWPVSTLSATLSTCSTQTAYACKCFITPNSSNHDEYCRHVTLF